MFEKPGRPRRAVMTRPPMPEGWAPTDHWGDGRPKEYRKGDLRYSVRQHMMEYWCVQDTGRTLTDKGGKPRAFRSAEAAMAVAEKMAGAAAAPRDGAVRG